MKFNLLKDRKSHLPIFRSFLLFFFIAVWWLFCSTLGSGQSKVTLAASDQATRILSNISLKKYNELISYVVKPGDTFLGILSQYGVSNDLAINCYTKLKPLGLMSIIPGDSLVLTRSDSGSMSAVTLLHKLDSWYTVSFNESGLQAHKKPVVSSVQRCIVRGVLSSSLSEDMNKMGVDDACVSKFADIFAWDINFFVDPQKGDSFQIVFEKKFAEGRFTGYGDIFAAEYVNKGHVFSALGIKDEKGAMRYFDLDGKSLQKQFLKAPLKFSHISSGYSLHRLHPVLGIVRPHLGVDYAAPTGTPVYASANGVITFAGYMGGFGNHIRIRHGASYETYYGHLHAIARGIRTGVRVNQGDLIGTVGQTGIATGPHLDYRMSISQRFVNPLTISVPREQGVSPENMAEYCTLKNQWFSILSMRFKGRTGCFVFDINKTDSVSKQQSFSSNRIIQPDAVRPPPS